MSTVGQARPMPGRGSGGGGGGGGDWHGPGATHSGASFAHCRLAAPLFLHSRYDITDKQPEVVLGRGMGVGEAFRRRLTEKCMMGTGYRSEYDTDDEELGSVCSMNTADVSHVHDLGKRLFSWAEVCEKREARCFSHCVKPRPQ